MPYVGTGFPMPGELSQVCLSHIKHSTQPAPRLSHVALSSCCMCESTCEDSHILAQVTRNYVRTRSAYPCPHLSHSVISNLVNCRLDNHSSRCHALPSGFVNNTAHTMYTHSTGDLLAAEWVDPATCLLVVHSYLSRWWGQA